MKKTIVAIAVVLVSLFLYSCVPDFLGTDSASGNQVVVEIPKGATVDSIAEILHDNDLIDNKLAFKLRVKMMGYSEKLNFGTFTLDDGMDIRDIIERLGRSGNQSEVTLVIPEGFSAENIAQRAESMGLCSEEAFLDALDDEYRYDFIAYIPEGDYKYKLQGFLFPDTYSFAPGVEPHDIIDALLANFDVKYKNNIGEYNSELFDIINKAALIEKEAKLESERPMIAGVIENRLAVDMPLQIDAAIVYAVSEGTFDVAGVSYRNLEVESPYNIYVNRGLTPGPICNPGISSIKAAVNPQDHDYLYYHTDTDKNDGSHIFTKTYDEHLSTQN